MQGVLLCCSSCRYADYLQCIHKRFLTMIPHARTHTHTCVRTRVVGTIKQTANYLCPAIEAIRVGSHSLYAPSLDPKVVLRRIEEQVARLQPGDK
jgi:hypothetical protein